MGLIELLIVIAVIIAIAGGIVIHPLLFLLLLESLLLFIPRGGADDGNRPLQARRRASSRLGLMVMRRCADTVETRRAPDGSVEIHMRFSKDLEQDLGATGSPRAWPQHAAPA